MGSLKVIILEWAVGVLSLLFLMSFVSCLIIVWKNRRDKSKLKDEIRRLKRRVAEIQHQNIRGSGQYHSTILTAIKTELEKQRDQLRGKLQEVETQLKENKTELQTVEDEIATTETDFDKPEELLRQKENLLKSQWGLDEKKKDYKRQLLKLDKLFEPLEVSGLMNRNQEVCILVEEPKMMSTVVKQSHTLEKKTQ